MLKVQLREEWNRWVGLQRTAVVFCLFACFYGAVQWQSGWRTPDSFYHSKMVERLALGTFDLSFPWLPDTVLSHAYADQHLLYHLLGVPFALAFGANVGLKVLGVALAAGVISLVHRMLERLGAPHPLLCASCVGLATYPASRLNLVKADALSTILQLLVVMIVLWMIGADKRWRLWPWVSLFGLGWASVWAHASWPLVPLLGCFYCVAVVGVQFLEKSGRPRSLSVPGLAKASGALVLLSAGVVVGLVLNPYYPSNLAYYWYQIFEVAVVKTGARIALGAEWRSITLEDLSGLLFLQPLVWYAMAVVGTILAGNRRPGGIVSIDTTGLFYLGLLFAFGMGISCYSIRYVHYCVIFMALFASALRCFADRYYEPLVLDPTLAKAFELLCVVSLTLNPISLYMSYHQQSLSWDELRRAATYIRGHSLSGDIVYNASWDYFPQLFYWNDRNRYVAGLDPTFMYHWNPELALRYERGLQSGVPFVDLTDALGARFVLVKKRYPKADIATALRKDVHFLLSYEDNEAVVFERVSQKE